MNMEQGQYVSSETTQDYNASFHKLMRMFTISILIAFIGTLIGTMIPPALMLPLIIVEVIMIISSIFIRRKGKPISYLFTYSFCFISGITIYPAIAAYSNAGGAGLVNSAFIVTVLLFAGLSFYAYYSKRDFSFLGGFLTMGLFALIGFMLIGLFIPSIHSGAMGLMIAFGGVMIFSGFILYDISQYRKGLSDEMIPLAVLSLYLSFINLFLFVLRLFGILSDD